VTDERDPDREEDLALIRAGIEAANRGDIDGLVALFDPEVEFHIAPGLGNAGTYHGREGFRNGLGGWLEAWESFTIDVVELEPIGERHVVGDVRQLGRGRGSGIEVEMRLGYLWEVRGGLAVRFHIVPDRETARAVARAGEGHSE
jgi:ketosteroid isomerase-like protein